MLEENVLDAYLVPVAVGKLLRRVSSLDPSTGDQDADVVAVVEDAFREGPNVGGISEVCCVYPRPPV